MEEYEKLSIDELDDLLNKLTNNAIRLRSKYKNNKIPNEADLEKLQIVESKIHNVIVCMSNVCKIKNEDNVYFILE